MRKWFPALALALLLSAYLSVTGLAAGTQIEVRPPGESVQAGETFEVTVELTGNPGFRAVQFSLDYDHDAMECDDMETGSLLDNVMAVTNPQNSKGATVLAASTSRVNGDGTLATVFFTAKRNLDSMNGFTLNDVMLRETSQKDIPFTVVIPNENTASPTPAQTVRQTTPTPADQRTTPTPADQRTTPTPTPARTVRQATPTPTPAARRTTPTPTPEPALIRSTPTPVPTDIDAGIVPDSPAEPGIVTPVPTSADASAEELPPSRFTDVAGNWAEESIRRGEALGLFEGFPAGEFHPNDPISRGDFITALWNLYGRPNPGTQTPFTDLTACREDTRKAVAWAFGQGYINGTTDETFYPEGPLTRQAAMKVLFLSSGGQSGPALLFAGIYDNAFEDSPLIADWARNAMYWGVYYTLIKGTTPTTLSPGGLLSGAQLAVILLRYVDRFPAT